MIRLEGKIEDLLRWRPGALARGTLHITLGLGLRTLIQACLFIGVARLLGIEKFGAFSAVLAIAGAMGQMGAMGSQVTLLRQVSRSQGRFTEAWTGTLAAAVFFATPLLVGYLLLALLFAPNDVGWIPILMLGVAEIVLAPLPGIAASAFQAHDRMDKSSRMIIAPALARFIALLALVPLSRSLADDQVLSAWCSLYAAGSLLAASHALRQVRIHLGRAQPLSVAAALRAARDGWPFAVGGLGIRAYADIDKTMLGRLDTLQATGAYSAGHRIADLATLPITAMLTAAMPRIFRESLQGRAATYMRQLLLLPLAYAALIAIVLTLLAPLLPWLLGAEFATSVQSLRWLAWLPLVSLPRLFLQNQLVGMDKQNAAVATLVAGAGLNIGLNLWLIPALSWRGAVLSTYLAETVMAIALLLIARRHHGHA